jgi:hypothetical protein
VAVVSPAVAVMAALASPYTKDDTYSKNKDG